jgi:hypothetical protein
MANNFEIKLFIIAIFSCFICGCTTNLTIQPQYVSSGISAPIIAGHANIVMTPNDHNFLFEGGPRSLTGAGTSIKIPIGTLIETVGEKVCSGYFAAGADYSTTLVRSGYNVSVKYDGFSYKFDELSNLGLLITPKISIALKIEILSGDGTVIVPEQRYEKIDYSATGAYFVSLHPDEKINQSLHMAIAAIFRDAMDRIPPKK